MPVEFVDIHNAVKNSNPELKARLEYLEGDDKVHEIRFLREQPDGMTRVPVTTYAANEGEHGVRADTVTYIDPDAPKYGPPESPLGTPEGVYAHEVGSHVFELATGTSTGEEINPKTGFETKEERANRMERLYLEGAGKKKE